LTNKNVHKTVLIYSGAQPGFLVKEELENDKNLTHFDDVFW